MKFRDNYIIKYIKNKKVLDLGFLGEDDSKDFSHLHELVLKFSKKDSLGVDIREDRVTKLKRQGENVLCDNVIYLKKLKKLNEKFDVILCGELIEHIEDCGIFLDNLKNFLKKDGKIILTTPNIFSLRHILRHILFNQESPYWKDRRDEINYGHVFGFSNMLFKNLLFRKGFKIIFNDYTIKNEYSGFKGNLEKVISKIFPRFAPTLLYVVKIK